MAPLALDPEERFPLVLRTDLAARGFDPDDPASDEKAAAAGAPHFLCRYMTCREWREYRQAGELDRDSTPPAQVQNDLFYALHLAIVGWQGLTDRDGQPLPSDPARLEEVLTPGEAWELYYRAQRYSRLSVAQKKDSGSPSATATGPSAPGAAGGPQTAETPPTSDSPPSSPAPGARETGAPSATSEESSP